MRGEGFPNQEEERLQAFVELRRQVNEQLERATAARIQKNPHPTEEEIRLGAFAEEIDPQVRDALFQFHKKGYSTQTCGFSGEFGEEQTLCGFYQLDDETKKAIRDLGVEVLSGTEAGFPGYGDKFTITRFKPTIPDLETIKVKWDQIADLLPDLGKQAGPDISPGGEEFRKKYSPERVDVELAVLKRELDLFPDMPEEVCKPLTDRIAEIEKASK